MSVLWHPDYALNPDTNPICSFREVLEPGKAQKLIAETVPPFPRRDQKTAPNRPHFQRMSSVGSFLLLKNLNQNQERKTNKTMRKTLTKLLALFMCM
ncbi:MAG: hypothetical protein IJI34_00995, partial [Clostridia bacterium]|nr:hypothetical protein [Clostridia bacterium]